MAIGDLSGPGGVISVDPRGAAAAAAGTKASTGLASTVASIGTIGALVMVAWLHLEVPTGSPEQGDQNPHNSSTCYWPSNTPLHNVLSNCKQCIRQELAIGPAAAMVAGDVAE